MVFKTLEITLLNYFSLKVRKYATHLVVHLGLLALTAIHKAEHHQNKSYDHYCKNSYHYNAIAPIH